MTDLVYFLELLPCRSIQRAHVEELISFSKRSTVLLYSIFSLLLELLVSNTKGPLLSMLYLLLLVYIPVALPLFQ